MSAVQIWSEVGVDVGTTLAASSVVWAGVRIVKYGKGWLRNQRRKRNDELVEAILEVTKKTNEQLTETNGGGHAKDDLVAILRRLEALAGDAKREKDLGRQFRREMRRSVRDVVNQSQQRGHELASLRTEFSALKDNLDGRSIVELSTTIAPPSAAHAESPPS